VIFATGFDAMSGALARINIQGRGGKTLREHWANDVRATFGMMASGFPNMFYISGPGSPAPCFSPSCSARAGWTGLPRSSNA
jgi:cyclohexanone monooxygenase